MSHVPSLTLSKAIFELILTEAAYVRDLQLIVEVREVFVRRCRL